MSDLTKCNAECSVGICPIKERCYRYMASPSTYQSYFVQAPGEWLPDGGFKCDMYWGKACENILKNFIDIVEGRKT